MTDQRVFGSHMLDGVVIDNHSHVFLPVEKHIGLMDEAGVDIAVVCRTLVHPENKTTVAAVEKEMADLDRIISGDPALARAKSEESLDELYEVVQKFPDRFIGFGIAPLGLGIDDMIAYIKSEVIARGFRGLGEYTLPPGQIDRLEAVFVASAATTDLPIWIHAFNPLVLQDIREIEALAQKYPSVPVVLGHMGGSNYLEAIEAGKRNANLYLDASACFSTFALKLAIDELPDKMLFGSDLPYGDMLLTRQTIERLCPEAEIRQKILGGNAAKLLGIG